MGIEEFVAELMMAEERILEDVVLDGLKKGCGVKVTRRRTGGWIAVVVDETVPAGEIHEHIVEGE